MGTDEDTKTKFNQVFGRITNEEKSRRENMIDEVVDLARQDVKAVEEMYEDPPAVALQALIT